MASNVYSAHPTCPYCLERWGLDVDPFCLQEWPKPELEVICPKCGKEMLAYRRAVLMYTVREKPHGR